MHALEQAFRACMSLAGFGELRTPLIEQLQLFVRSVGEGTDIVDKELFLLDFHGEQLALRPEGTASAVRALLEHKLHTQKPVTRLWYSGPMFRGERPQKGRYRQFSQLGAEVFGDPGPGVDAEIIDLLWQFLRSLGIDDARVHLGSLGGSETRARYRQALLDYLTPRKSELSEESQRRLSRNPLRILDSKNPGDRQVLQDAPSLQAFLDDSDLRHFEELQALLRALGTPFEVDLRLVRGLDYYSRTLFEIKGASDVLGSGDTLVGGARYDGLVASWGGPSIPAFGFAAGAERLLLAQRERARAAAVPSVFIAPLGAAAAREALKIARELRAIGIAAEPDLRGGSARSLFKRADALGAHFAVVLGDREIEAGVVQLKHLRAAEATQEELARDGLACAIAARLQQDAVQNP